MKNNKNKLNKNSNLQKDISVAMKKFYKECMSESIKRGIRNKKNSSTR